MNLLVAFSAKAQDEILQQVENLAKACRRIEKDLQHPPVPDAPDSREIIVKFPKKYKMFFLLDLIEEILPALVRASFESVYEKRWSKLKHEEMMIVLHERDNLLDRISERWINGRLKEQLCQALQEVRIYLYTPRKRTRFSQRIRGYRDKGVLVDYSTVV